ncbi:MAG TPA: ornithine cyclodeaminase family protein [Solirubrobacteraceae bacterium]|nr:ornithine cyclodeaminase family protein [Solirubrobacteraceae bacterium]
MIARPVGCRVHGGCRPADELLIAVINHDAVLDAVSPAAAIDLVGDAFLRHQHGDWQMPAKVYLQSPPHGDFRAMPARGDGIALLKWVSSFPANAGIGVPTVSGVVVLSDATTGAPLALIDARSVTALRTGAAAAVASRALARPDATTVGLIGCGLNGAATARCMAAAGYGRGICADPRAQAAGELAQELGWEVGSTADALRCDIVCCVTPGAEPVLEVGALRPGTHFNMLGADGSGKAEATIDAVVGCDLFCDQWEQASHGGELAGAVAVGRVARSQVTSLGAVLAGEAPGRGRSEAITLFDSTGLAIQDLAIGIGVLAAWRAGRVAAEMVSL